MNVFALEGDSDRPLALDENGLLETRVEGETPDAYLETTGDRANNNTNNEHVIHVTKNGVTYTIGYALNRSTILPEEISGMDSDQALEYIANKSMTFYTDRNATVIPDIVFGRDYFVRVNGLTHVTPDTLRGSYRLEIANNSGFNNAATTTVTIGNSGNGGSGGNTGAGNEDRTNTNGHSTATNVVQSLARRISSGTRVRGANRAPSAARVHQVNQNAISDSSNASAANSVNNSSESSRSSASADGRGSGSAGNGISSSRTVETVANAATAGAGAGSAWLAVLIISDIKLLLWYKKLKEAKRK
ncbi:hypothetical protein [Mogibacterium diversum]|jgi:hypothetical protein|uniref:hypothetical protein n=1 Tax=Mogibacterium diversum TaxID=114527 RepID=UPI0028E92003|nr:hypothetical protein [Mogibacterium diversum]